jgi:hypothetical protein
MFYFLTLRYNNTFSVFLNVAQLAHGVDFLRHLVSLRRYVVRLHLPSGLARFLVYIF